MDSPFGRYLSDHRAQVDACVTSAFAQDTGTDLGRYLYGPLEAFSANGGKRTRPIICLAACEAVGGDAADALASACAIEQFQTAALVHDDIADEGELRRGMPCLHRTVGVGLATNCGDRALMQVSDAVLSDVHLDAETRLAVLAELVAMMERTCEGQALDLGWARDGRWDVTCDDYLDMATRKTAYYSGGVPLAVGAIIGHGTTEQVDALRAFGMDTGLAFQLRDDLLNLAGDENAQGKDFRSDITEGKRTLLAVHALSHTTGPDHDELLDILSSHVCDEDVLARAVDIIAAAGSLDYSRALSAELVSRAKARLEGVTLESRSKDVLLSMADFFVERLG